MVVKATFDLDGVLIDTTAVICHRLGIDYEKIDVYSIAGNKSLSERQKSDIFKLFGDPSVYWKAANRDAFRALNTLAEKCEITIHSFCNDKLIARVKREICEQYAPNVKNIVTELVGHVDRDKDIEVTDVLVEDRFDTLVSEYNDYKYGIMIRQPYNREIDLDIYPKIEAYDDIVDAIEVLDKACESGEWDR